MIYVKGKMIYVKGEMIYVKGKIIYVKGKTIYVKGEMIYVKGKIIYVNDSAAESTGKNRAMCVFFRFSAFYKHCPRGRVFIVLAIGAIGVVSQPDDPAIAVIS